VDELLIPDWPCPENVRAAVTTRAGGVSTGPYASLNLGDHVGDDPDNVRENRRRLQRALDLPSPPHWLRQVHGCRVHRVGESTAVVDADASVSDRPGRVCAVLTADCLPLLICNRSGTRVAAVHAGWRGLAAGVVEAVLACFDDAPRDLMVWLGPAIGPDRFEVGPEVRESFVRHSASCAGAFRRGTGDRWLADIYELARLRLGAQGVSYVGGGQYCTVSDSTNFFSYRRDGATGRMASLIWMTPESGH